MRMLYQCVDLVNHESVSTRMKVHASTCKWNSHLGWDIPKSSWPKIDTFAGSPPYSAFEYWLVLSQGHSFWKLFEISQRKTDRSPIDIYD